MKINDIITEAGILGSIGRGIGKGLTNAIAPNLSKIAGNQIKAAPVGAIGVINAPTGTVTTPAGEEVKKFSNGYWYDKQGQVIVNKNDLTKLEQELAKQIASPTRAEPAEYEPTLKWDYKKGILSVDSDDYQKQKDGGWKHLNTDELVIQSAVPELNNFLSIAKGNRPLPSTAPTNKNAATPLMQPSAEFKSRPPLATQPDATPTPTQPARQRTGGRVAGQVSQTPNAQRKRKAREVARTEMPAVMQSNRPAVFKSNRPQ